MSFAQKKRLHLCRLKAPHQRGNTKTCNERRTGWMKMCWLEWNQIILLTWLFSASPKFRWPRQKAKSNEESETTTRTSTEPRWYRRITFFRPVFSIQEICKNTQLSTVTDHGHDDIASNNARLGVLEQHQFFAHHHKQKTTEPCSCNSGLTLPYKSGRSISWEIVI